MRNDLLKEEGCGAEFPECSVASGFTYAVHIAKTAEVHILARYVESSTGSIYPSILCGGPRSRELVLSDSHLANSLFNLNIDNNAPEKVGSLIDKKVSRLIL